MCVYIKDENEVKPMRSRERCSFFREMLTRALNTHVKKPKV